MPTDTERIDFLQKITEDVNYTGKVVCRWSAFGRGWRLHETSKPDGMISVRDAIDLFMKENV